MQDNVYNTLGSGEFIINGQQAKDLVGSWMSGDETSILVEYEKQFTLSANPFKFLGHRFIN